MEWAVRTRTRHRTDGLNCFPSYSLRSASWSPRKASALGSPTSLPHLPKARLAFRREKAGAALRPTACRRFCISNGTLVHPHPDREHGKQQTHEPPRGDARIWIQPALPWVMGDTNKHEESRLRKFEQVDKWSFCLTAGTLMPANQERR